MEERKEGLFRNMSWKLKGAIFILVVVVGIVDIPQTIRIKALIINALPLHPKTTISLVEKLCQAAHSTSSGVSNCFAAHHSESAIDKIIKARNNVEKK